MVYLDMFTPSSLGLSSVETQCCHLCSPEIELIFVLFIDVQFCFVINFFFQSVVLFHNHYFVRMNTNINLIIVNLNLNVFSKKRYSKTIFL